MKRVVIFILLLLIIPIFIYTSAFGRDENAREITTGLIALPYLIEITEPNGEINQISGLSRASTPFEIASEFGAAPIEKDQFSAFPDIKMAIGSKISMKRTPTYYIVDGKKTSEYRSWAKTVAELLAENNIELGLEDKINFAPDSEIAHKITIVIVRVARTVIIEKEVIEFKTTKTDDPTLDRGKTRVKQAGKAGRRDKYFEVVREDGAEVNRSLKKVEIVIESVPEIILVGSKPVITVRCRYNDMVIEAAAKYNYDPDKLCRLMMKESNGNTDSVSADGYRGLFQYSDGFWAQISAKAGLAGADIFDPPAQIQVTAWALTHGFSNRWPVN